MPDCFSLRSINYPPDPDLSPKCYWAMLYIPGRLNVHVTTVFLYHLLLGIRHVPRNTELIHVTENVPVCNVLHIPGHLPGCYHCLRTVCWWELHHTDCWRKDYWEVRACNTENRHDEPYHNGPSSQLLTVYFLTQRRTCYLRERLEQLHKNERSEILTHGSDTHRINPSQNTGIHPHPVCLSYALFELRQILGKHGDTAGLHLDNSSSSHSCVCEDHRGRVCTSTGKTFLWN